MNSFKDFVNFYISQATNTSGLQELIKMSSYYSILYLPNPCNVQHLACVARTVVHVTAWLSLSEVVCVLKTRLDYVESCNKEVAMTTARIYWILHFKKQFWKCHCLCFWKNSLTELHSLSLQPYMIPAAPSPSAIHISLFSDNNSIDNFLNDGKYFNDYIQPPRPLFSISCPEPSVLITIRFLAKSRLICYSSWLSSSALPHPTISSSCLRFHCFIKQRNLERRNIFPLLCRRVLLPSKQRCRRRAVFWSPGGACLGESPLLMSHNSSCPDEATNLNLIEIDGLPRPLKQMCLLLSIMWLPRRDVRRKSLEKRRVLL